METTILFGYSKGLYRLIEGLYRDTRVYWRIEWKRNGKLNGNWSYIEDYRLRLGLRFEGKDMVACMPGTLEPILAAAGRAWKGMYFISVSCFRKPSKLALVFLP